MKSKLWGGRFSASQDATVDAFTESVSLDQRLALVDIRASIAHVQMLAHSGIVSDDDMTQMVTGLKAIAEEIQQGHFVWESELEDVHMNIEAALVRRIGDGGKKLHTARSRNDQVATAMRLYLRDSQDLIAESMLKLLHQIVERAQEHAETIMPGMTHLQAAQPIVLGHHLMAWFEMLWRDYDRLVQARQRLNQCPLGAAALAGSSFAIDRHFVAHKLGFDRPMDNSMDAVSDRDFIIEFVGLSALLMVHFSRISEEIVLWSNPYFDFAQAHESLCTGSSIMPQKRNPDIAELLRGKAASVVGQHTAMLVLMKAQPLAYNRDNQEDKQPLFDCIDTVQASVTMMHKLIAGLRFNQARLRSTAAQGFSTATDLADYLVQKGVAFRDAHAQVGATVKDCMEQGLSLEQLSLEQLRTHCPAAESDVQAFLTVEGSIKRRCHIGGTAPAQVRKACADAKRRLSEAVAGKN